MDTENWYMKPVKEQLFIFLRDNPSVWHGGQLQRKDFITRMGGFATGDNIKRRLNELVEEGKIHVSYNERNEAMFSIKQEHRKKRQVVETYMKDGLPVTRITYVMV